MKLKFFLSIFIILLITCNLVSAALEDGLISYWKHDDATTSNSNSLDSLGINDAVIFEAITGVSGKINEAYNFDGSNDYVQAADDDSFDVTSMSFNAWVYHETDQTGIIISRAFANFDRWIYAYIYQNDFYATVCNSAGTKYNTPATPLATGGWHMVTVVYKTGDYLKVYVDGDEKNTQGVVGDLTQNSEKLTIGQTKETYYTGSPFDGSIDEVGVWGRALSPAELIELWNNGDGWSYTPVVDTCTAPGSGNWEVDCSDNCEWNAPQDVPANMIITGSGHLKLSDIFTFTGLNQYIYIFAGCLFEILTSGGIQ